MPACGRMLEQIPVERPCLAPFAALGELLPHEQQLLAGIAPHEGVVGAQVGELLPVVARHLAEQRALAVHHLVVAERQHEILAEGVEQAEGDLA